MREFDRVYRAVSSVALFCALGYWTHQDLADGRLDNALLLAALIALATGAGAALAEWIVRR